MSWSKITVNNYYDLLSLNPDDYETRLDFLCDYVSMATGKDIEEIENMNYEDLISLYKSLSFLKVLPSEIGEVDGYNLLPFKKISLGEFIDLEHYLHQPENIHFISAILFKKTKINEWDELQYELYKYDVVKRSEFFLNQSIDKVGAILDQYIKHRNFIIETYEPLFQPPSGDEENEEELTEEIKREIEQEKKFQKFAWEKMIMNLVEHTGWTFDEITNHSHILIFNLLSMMKNL